MAELAVLIPAMRSELVAGLVENIHAATRAEHRIYVMTNRERVAKALEGHDVTVWRDRLRSWGQRLNAMAKRTTEPYLFLGADDVRFWANWDIAAMRDMRRVDGVVAVNDHLNPAGTLALVSRRYLLEEGGTIDGSGLVIHRGYRHQFSETELFATARMRGRFSHASDSVVEHLHWYTGKLPLDDVYKIGIANEARDAELFRSREHLWS